MARMTATTLSRDTGFCSGCSLTPVGGVVSGLVAGAVGTTAMDTLLFARYRRSGGGSGLREWELSSGLRSWDDAPAPAQVGRRVIEGLFQITPAPSRARLVNNVTHWATGILAGLQYGIVAGSLPGADSLRAVVRRHGLGGRLRDFARREAL
jgi:hypothetical protein